MIIEKDYTVGIKDVDSTRKTTNKAFMTYMENVSCIPSDIVGYGINDIPKNNFAWILLDWKVKILKRPEYGADLTATTWSRGIEKNLYAYRDFEIVDEEGNDVAIATSRWILINFKEHKILKITDEIRDAYPNVDKELFENYKFEKMVESEKYDEESEYKIRKVDLDLNSHVNNINYLNIAFEALPISIEECYNFENIRITYKHEVVYGETVKVSYEKIDNKYKVVIKSQDDERLHSIIELW